MTYLNRRLNLFTHNDIDARVQRMMDRRRHSRIRPGLAGATQRHVIVRSRAERAALRRIDKAAVMFRRCCKLLDSGDLLCARQLLCDYGFALLDAKALLRQGKPNLLLDATVDRALQTGLNYMDYLDEAIREENPQ